MSSWVKAVWEEILNYILTLLLVSVTQSSQHNGSDDHQNCLKIITSMSIIRKLGSGFTWMKSVQMTAASPPATVKMQAMASKIKIEI